MDLIFLERGATAWRAGFLGHGTASAPASLPGCGGAGVVKDEVGVGPSWSTASFDGAVGASVVESTALGDHLVMCRALRGRLFGLHCAAEAVEAFVATRFVTTVAVLTLILGLGSLAR